MNKIEKLIKELCPNGVEWKKLGDVLDYEQPSKYIVKSTEYRISFRTPVLTAGQSFILGYTDEIDGIFQASKGNPVIIFDDFTTSFHWVDFDFKVKSSAMKMLRMKFDKALFRYVYLYMQTFSYVPMDHSRQWIGTYSDFEIPLPPLPIQTEIVRILDKFVEQQEQLERLIELRKKQYEYYREELLKPKEGEKWETVTIGELGTITRGRRFVRDDVRDSGMPCIHYGDMYTYYGITAKNTKTFLDRDFPKKMQYAKKGDVVVVGAGENDLDIGVGTVWDGEEPAAVHDACYILEHKQNPKYIAYFLRTNNYHQQLRKYVSDGKICSISSKGLGSCFIPIPSLTKQQEIVDFLDKFEQNLLDLKSALEQSKARYEYYRDQLLKF